MTERHAPKPSPLVGEGAAQLRRAAGEGAFGTKPPSVSPLPGHAVDQPSEALRKETPHPDRAKRGPPSPARGEGTGPVARAVNKSTATLRARELRSNMTDAERKLWFALRDRRFANFKFRRQVPLGPFIADYVCFDARVVVEVDGGQHAKSRRDERRDQWLAANGFVVRRFWNNDVLKNLEGVLISLLETLHQRPPHPDRAKRGRPSPTRGEGNGARGAAAAKDATR